MSCVRCGRQDKIERHHIVPQLAGGSDEPENMENRCLPCHKYVHTRRSLLGALEAETERGQTDRIVAIQHRIDVLDELNAVDTMRERGTYVSYWSHMSTHRLPRRIPTVAEAAETRRWNRLIAGAQGQFIL